MNLPLQKYFRLNPECYLVKGADRGAIYNLLSGDIISLNPKNTNILIDCEEGKSIKEIINSTDDQCLVLFEKLREIKAGSFYEKKIYIKKYGDRDPWKTFSPVPPVLSLGFIELSNLCELECFFCKGNEIKPFYRGCLGCSKWPIDGEKQLELSDWTKVLSQLNDLECRDLVIVGGNPLLIEDKFKALVNEIRSFNFKKIFVYTNGMYLPENIIKLLEKYEVYPIIQVFSCKPNEYKLITGRHGRFNILTNNLHKLIKNSVKFSITILVSQITQNSIEKIIESYNDLMPENIYFNYLYPTYNNLSDFSPEYCEKLIIAKKNLPRISVEDFYNKKDYNSCLRGKIAITAEGDILPCIMMRDDIIGNIRENSLQDIFADKKIDLYWELSKDKIDICKKCEYRYACSDCRALEKSVTKNLYGRKYCAYNPNKGEWATDFLTVLQ